MPDIERPALRGFDSYEVRLGDELRGHRASLGKSLLDVQRDLRIRASYIDAIENCDPSVIPNKGFVAGYVRAYARYLLLDPEEIYRRFCDESGFAGAAARRPATPAARPATRGGGASAIAGRLSGLRRGTTSRAAYDPALARNHFSTPLGSARRVGMGVSLSGLASVAVLAALIGGLGWGAWLVVEDVQRVAFAPSPEAPGAIETPPNIAIPGLSLTALAATGLERDAEREAALAALYAPRDMAAPDIALRDGPIAAIDPDAAGLFGRRPEQSRGPNRDPDAASSPARKLASRDAPLSEQNPDGADSAGPALAAADAAIGAEPEPSGEQAALATAPPEAEGVWLVVTDDAWIRVRAGDGSTLAQRIFKPGERFRLPDDLEGAVLRAGNAGGVYIEVNGALHGPLGKPGGVAKRVSLTPAAIQSSYAVAQATPAAVAEAEFAPRTEAKLEID